MQLPEWLSTLGKQIAESSILEWVGVTLGVIQVFLAKANKVLLYPFGIASILVTVYVLYDVGLYAEILLHVYYLVTSVYGWIYWAEHKANPTPVAYSDKREWGITLLIVLLGFPVLYFALRFLTDSTVPVWDAWVSATAWAGMWLLAKRKIENWILLNISNAFAIPLLIHKDLILYGLLTFILFVVAIFGYLEWKKIIMRAQKGDLRHV